MRKFEFSLQKLLDVKNSSIELLKIEILKANKEVEELRAKVEDMTEEISRAQKKMDGETKSVHTLLEWMNYIQSLYTKRKELVSKLSSMERHLDDLREEYAKLYKEHKALQNLRQLQKDAYDLDMLREEQKIIDDLAIVRGVKKQK